MDPVLSELTSLNQMLPAFSVLFDRLHGFNNQYLEVSPNDTVNNLLRIVFPLKTASIQCVTAPIWPFWIHWSWPWAPLPSFNIMWALNCAFSELLQIQGNSLYVRRHFCDSCFPSYFWPWENGSSLVEVFFLPFVSQNIMSYRWSVECFQNTPCWTKHANMQF